MKQPEPIGEGGLKPCRLEKWWSSMKVVPIWTWRGVTDVRHVPRGQRVYVKQRRNYGKNMTLLAGLRLDGMTDSLVIEGAVTTPVFEAFVEQILLPTLQPGDVVVLDNLVVHKSSRVEQLLLSHACQILFLPAYSPDLSPIEQAFSKIKQFLRTLRAQTVDALMDAIADALRTITPYDAIGFFTQAGFLNLD